MLLMIKPEKIVRVGLGINHCNNQVGLEWDEKIIVKADI